MKKVENLRNKFLEEERGSNENFDALLNIINKNINRPNHPIDAMLEYRHPQRSTEWMSRNQMEFGETYDLFSVFTTVCCPFCDARNYRAGWCVDPIICCFCEREIRKNHQRPEGMWWKGFVPVLRLNYDVVAPLCNRCCDCNVFTLNEKKRCSSCYGKILEKNKERHRELLDRLINYLLRRGYGVLGGRHLIDLVAMNPNKDKTTWKDILGFEVKSAMTKTCIDKAIDQCDKWRKYCDKVYVVLPSYNEEIFERLKKEGIGYVVVNKRSTKFILDSKREECVSTDSIGAYEGRMFVLRRYNIRGRSKAYKSPDLAKKLLIDNLGEKGAKDALRACLYKAITPDEVKGPVKEIKIRPMKSGS